MSGTEKFVNTYSETTRAKLKDEFPTNDEICYLDHAGATLYSSQQMTNIFEDLKSQTFGNPHSRSSTSKNSDEVIDQVRYQILEHFSTTPDEYSVIFTSGATAALKLIAESFNYAGSHSMHHGTFAHLEDNHTSVLGMRAYAKDIRPVHYNKAFELFGAAPNTETNDDKPKTNSLFVYPAQCNFTGTKYPLEWISKVHDGYLNDPESDESSSNWYCVLDAASFVATSPLNLSQYKPDFVCVSFYKMLGYPTGLGALIMKNASAHVFNKTYFGGGTVLMAMAGRNKMVPKEKLNEFYEAGTLPFLEILALRHGFETLKRLRLSMKLISLHTFRLAKYVHDNLSTLHHSNGRPLCRLYNDTNFSHVEVQGGIINFNLLRDNGEFIGYSEVMNIANLFGIQLRTGCFCNPGACQRKLNVSLEDIQHHFDRGHVCGDANDLIDQVPTGSVRISFGYMSTKAEADLFLETITDCFCTKPAIRKSPIYQEANLVPKQIEAKPKLEEIKSGISGILQSIYVYPIKSCAAFKVSQSWQLTDTGLEYDRVWMIVNEAGVCLTQKHDTNMCKIRPIIDLNNNKLVLQFESTMVEVPLDAGSQAGVIKDSSLCHTKVCTDTVQAADCGDEVADFLSKALRKPNLRLLRQMNSKENQRNTKSNVPVSLANQSQYLFINRASVQWLYNRIPKDKFTDDIETTIQRFRPNFVVDFEDPFIENSYATFTIDNQINLYSDGKCTRCQMICINQSNGKRTVEPLKTLAKEFSGQISFGIYLKRTEHKRQIILVNTPVSAS